MNLSFLTDRSFLACCLEPSWLPVHMNWPIQGVHHLWFFWWCLDSPYSGLLCKSFLQMNRNFADSSCCCLVAFFEVKSHGRTWKFPSPWKTSACSVSTISLVIESCQLIARMLVVAGWGWLDLSHSGLRTVHWQLCTIETARTNLQVVRMPGLSKSWSGMSVMAGSWIGHWKAMD